MNHDENNRYNNSEHTPQLTQYVTWEEDSPDTSSVIQHLFQSPDDVICEEVEENEVQPMGQAKELMMEGETEKNSMKRESVKKIQKKRVLATLMDENHVSQDRINRIRRGEKRREKTKNHHLNCIDQLEDFSSPGQKITEAVLKRRTRRVSTDDNSKQYSVLQSQSQSKTQHQTNDRPPSHPSCRSREDLSNHCDIQINNKEVRFSSVKKRKTNIVSVNKVSSGKRRSHMFEAMMREIVDDIATDPIHEAVSGSYNNKTSPLVNEKLRSPLQRSPTLNKGISSPFVNFDDDAFAMMDALVEQRIMAQKKDVDKGFSKKVKCVGSIECTSKSPAREALKTELTSPDPFGHLPDIDFEAMDRFVLSTRTSTLSEAQKLAKNQFNCSRFVVSEVYDDSASFTKSLRVIPFDAGDNFIHHGSNENIIHLRGEWYYSMVKEGNVVHLISVYGRNACDLNALPVTLHTDVIDDVNDDLLIVINPDVLISPTNISESTECIRRSVLKSRMGSSGLSNKAAIIGTMRHDLFQTCITNKNIEHNFVKSAAERIIRSNAENLVGCSLDDAEALHELMITLPQIRTFFEAYTSFNRRNKQPVKLPCSMQNNQSVNIQINDVFATEQQVVVPELGLKGFIDATTKTSLSNAINQNGLMPLELKTGHFQKFQVAHGAQLALYLLMMKVRYGVDVVDRQCNFEFDCNKTQPDCGVIDGGLLLYLNGKGIQASYVSPSFREMKSLIGNRNTIAHELLQSSQPRGITSKQIKFDDELNESSSIQILPATAAKLPQCIGKQRQCYRCYSNKECAIYARTELLNSFQTKESQSMQHSKFNMDVIDQLTNHLSNDEVSYFMDWDRMVDLEANEACHNIIKSWLIPSKDREGQSGLCLSCLEWDSDYVESVCQVDGESRVLLKFYRTSSLSLSSSQTQSYQFQSSFSNLKIEVGDHVVVSSDVGTYGVRRIGHNNGYSSKMHIVRGIVKMILDTSIYVTTSIGEMNELRCYESRLSKLNCVRSRYRLDKDEIITGIGGLRQNLVKFFTADIRQPVDKSIAIECDKSKLTGVPKFLPPRLQRLRELIVKLTPPQFDHHLLSSMFSGPEQSRAFEIKGCDFMDLVTEFHDLNPDQRNAVEKVVIAKDYTIVQGMPGTGKTSVIAFVARLLAAQGKRVLITSYTHSAVDNLLIKLLEAGVEPGALLRIGTKSCCHFAVHDTLALSVAAGVNHKDGSPSASSLSRVMTKARIVGVTALTCNRSPLLINQHFDVVICDEAGQLTQPVSLGPLMNADKFILVGDHQQLPPLVVSTAAEKAGYGVSLMSRLAGAHPKSVAKLTLQYRMNGDISDICNEVMYKGALKCASTSIESSRLALRGFPTEVPTALKSLSTIQIEVQEKDCSNVLQSIIDPTRPVVFINTDTVESSNMCSAKSEKDWTLKIGLEKTFGRKCYGGNVVNDYELNLVKLTVHSLLQCGAKPSDIGIISPFRSQIRRLSEDSFLAGVKNDGVEISTIDKYQGRDKSIIIISLVRSNIHGKAGKLLNDSRRINVAVSRAKHKLILIGSSWTMQKGSETLSSLLDFMNRKGWVLNMPDNTPLSVRDQF